MNALVLSGGGAKGAWQAGRLQRLLEDGRTFDIIAGTSVGALNGGMLAMNKWNYMEEIWRTVRNEDIYLKEQTLHEEVLNVIVKAISGGNVDISEIWDIVANNESVYSNDPLWDLVQRFFVLEDVKTDFRIGVAALTEGTYHSLRAWDFFSGKEFQRAVLASTAMPIIWPCLQSLVLAHVGVNINEVCDGGVLHVSPIMDVLGEADHLTIISCQNPLKKSHGKHPTLGVVPKLGRVLDMLLEKSIGVDVERFLESNSYAHQAGAQGFDLTKVNGEALRYIPAEIHLPQVDLGDSLEFTDGFWRFEEGHDNEDGVIRV